MGAAAVTWPTEGIYAMYAEGNDKPRTQANWVQASMVRG